MARYDIEFTRGYGLEYRGARRVFEPERRPARGGWGFGRRYEGAERAGYGREYLGEEREAMGYPRRPPGYGREYRGYAGLGYGREYAGRGYGRGYAKSRWEIDYGDPFRDRERGTPIRMTRGEFGEYGGEYRGWSRYGPEYRERRRRY